MPPSSANGSHDAFAVYLARTKNTICGRHPIGVLLGALSVVETGNDGNASTDGGSKTATIEWVRYEQSSQCREISDSSVSYASAYVVF